MSIFKLNSIRKNVFSFSKPYLLIKMFIYKLAEHDRPQGSNLLIGVISGSV